MQRFTFPRNTLLALIAAACCAGCQSQQTFSTPDEAVDALALAARQRDRSELRALFGPRTSELRSPDEDQASEEALIFTRNLEAGRQISMNGDDSATLLVGKDGWPFAVPIVKGDKGWRFDTEAGIEEVTNRRIGRNELHTIATCRTVIDAQNAYRSIDRNGDGIPEYAQRLMSTEGKKDGLYWPAPGGVDPSPIGPALALAAARTDDGGKRLPFNGYHFKPLHRRGPGAPGGAGDYRKNGRLTEGWAAIAYPAQYDVTGIMSFQFSSDGTVYERDLGDNTEAVVKGMDAYDPSNGWAPAAN